MHGWHVEDTELQSVKATAFLWKLCDWWSQSLQRMMFNPTLLYTGFNVPHCDVCKKWTLSIPSLVFIYFCCPLHPSFLWKLLVSSLAHFTVVCQWNVSIVSTLWSYCGHCQIQQILTLTSFSSGQLSIQTQSLKVSELKIRCKCCKRSKGSLLFLKRYHKPFHLC